MLAGIVQIEENELREADCRRFVGIFDEDHDGLLNGDEFQGLLRFCMTIAWCEAWDASQEREKEQHQRSGGGEDSSGGSKDNPIHSEPVCLPTTADTNSDGHDLKDSPEERDQQKVHFGIEMEHVQRIEARPSETLSPQGEGEDCDKRCTTTSSMSSSKRSSRQSLCQYLFDELGFDAGGADMGDMLTRFPATATADTADPETMKGVGDMAEPGAGAIHGDQDHGGMVVVTRETKAQDAVG